MKPLIQLKQTTSVFLIAFGLTCFGLSPTARAVIPVPDGGYPGQNTAEGDFALLNLSSGQNNTAIGFDALGSNTTSSNNTAIGDQALVHNSTGAGNNTAVGHDALFENATGSYNTAIGYQALYHNTIDGSTAIGYQALSNNTTGYDNMAIGFEALNSNTTGADNTAVGFQALLSVEDADNNTAVGSLALQNNVGDSNTAVGFGALEFNTGSSPAGSYNVAIGDSALNSNTTGSNNTAIGSLALVDNRTGFNNVAIGNLALSSNRKAGNTAIGVEALSSNTTGQSNVALGDQAGSNLTTGSNNIDIGAGVNGIAGESNACRIGSIFGRTAANGSAVFITSGHKLGTATSSKRFKENINPMNRASEVIFSLKPVAFRYKKEIDPERIPQFGLVAEDVEKVNPDLIVRDKEGKPNSVRYDQVNAMLLNEFLKEHRKVQEQEATIAQLKKNFGTTVAQLVTRLDEQAAQIQKVSAQLAAASPSGGGLEVSKPALRVVENNQ